MGSDMIWFTFFNFGLWYSENNWLTKDTDYWGQLQIFDTPLIEG